MTRKSRANQNNNNTGTVNVEAMRKNLVEAQQAVVSLNNMGKQFHKLAFLALVELRQKDNSNRMFSNGMVSATMLEKIDMACKIDKNDLPEGAFDDFKGDNKAGLSPDSIKQ